MNHARADALAARSHLATHGWIPRNAEAFRHLPPPDAPLWLGDGVPGPLAPAEGGWELDPLPAHAECLDAQWLDAADPAQRRELLRDLPPPGSDAAAPFAWAHRALVQQALRLVIRPAPHGGDMLVRVRRWRGAVEAPLLVVELLPGARCVLVENHGCDEDSAAGQTAGAGAVQNLQVHVHAGEGAALRHLRVAVPSGADHLAHHVHVRLQRDATYEQVLLAGGSSYHLQRTVLDLEEAGAVARTGSVLLAAATALDHQIVAHHGAAQTRSAIDVLALGSGAARVVANAHTTIAAGSDDAQTRQRLVGVPTAGQPKLVLRPHLEIHHDQVQAAHGATWGALPQEALFHARQRGLDEATAKAMIVEGMAAAVFARALTQADALGASGLEAVLSRAVAGHLAAGCKETRHG